MKFEQGILTTAKKQLLVRQSTLRYQCMARLQISMIVADVGISFRVVLYLEQYFSKLIETDDTHG